MADRALVATVDPLTVTLLDAGTTMPGVLLASTPYAPTEMDVVTVIPMSDGQALLLGRWSR